MAVHDIRDVYTFVRNARWQFHFPEPHHLASQNVLNCAT